MKIDSPNRNKIIVELSGEDMASLDITYDELDYSNIETRRVIWTILAKARKSLGRDIDPSGKIIIETLPAKSGGCMILFTVNDTGDTKNPLCLPAKKKSENPVYEFENMNSVIDLYRSIKESCGGAVSGELYSDGKGKYRIIANDFPDIDFIKRRFTEYGSFCGESPLVCAVTKEHWKRESADFFSR